MYCTHPHGSRSCVQLSFLLHSTPPTSQAGQADEVPVGAVIVIDDEIVAAAHNQVETVHDATAHAEMLAIRAACAKV